MRRIAPPVLAVLALASIASVAVAAQDKDEAALLWATVNVCDTDAYPDTIGVRASMPGEGAAQVQMFMRFRALFFDPGKGRWRSLAKGGDSGFVAVGSGKYRARQAGHLFRFAAPTGRSYELRGLVTFEWRRDGVVVRRASRLTTQGHKSTAGADPPGFSAGICVIG